MFFCFLWVVVFLVPSFPYFLFFSSLLTAVFLFSKPTKKKKKLKKPPKNRGLKLWVGKKMPAPQFNFFFLHFLFPNLSLLTVGVLWGVDCGLFRFLLSVSSSSELSFLGLPLPLFGELFSLSSGIKEKSEMSFVPFSSSSFLQPTLEHQSKTFQVLN